jgi:formylglycine-generating enzyme required for sulfatase activity
VPILLVLISSANAMAQRQQVRRCGQRRRVFRIALLPRVVVVPAGEFMMGSPENEKSRGKDEGPRRKVSIRESPPANSVTFAQWDACVAENGCSQTGRPGLPPAAGHQCVMGNAKQFVAWLSRKTGQSYRLLTEAEWEYATRGVTKASDAHTPFSTGATINYKQANYDANFTYNGGPMGIYRQKTVDVGTFRRNAFGLHDMHGNVWEWVEDCYTGSYANAPTDGSAVTSMLAAFASFLAVPGTTFEASSLRLSLCDRW